MIKIDMNSMEITNREHMIQLIHEDNSKIYENIIHIYHIVFHIFLFSIFESIFFWFYIVDQEEKVFKKHFSQIKMISDLICSNIELDLEPYYDYIEKEHRNYNNQVPLRFTYMLNVFLLFTLLLMNLILKWHKLNLIHVNIMIVKSNSTVLCLLFCYEYLFFQNIIYNYKPKSMMNIPSMLLEQCSM